MSIARTLEISDDIFRKWGYMPERDELKERLGRGRHQWRGRRYEIHRDAIPADAVLSIPEQHPNRKTWVYSVISDEFTEDDSPYLTPEATEYI